MSDDKAPALIVEEPDGTRIVVTTSIDSLEVYHGKKIVHGFSMSVSTARQLAWFVLWHYFIRWLRFGLRTRWHERRLAKRLRGQAIKLAR